VTAKNIQKVVSVGNWQRMGMHMYHA